METPDSPRNAENAEQATGIYYAPWEKSADRILMPFERFVHQESTSALCLIAAAILALVLANSALHGLYHDITHMKAGFSIGGLALENTIHHWVNDGLMTLFFFVVGLELKREILVGELASPRKAALPIIAAIGGMAVPALLYVFFNPSGIAAKGWAIPMATDIAFAIGIMVLLGDRVPRALMAFLVALAITDDLGAVAVIALFYTDTLSLPPLLAAAGLTGCLVFFNAIGIRRAVPYFIVAVFLWFAMLYSGLHPTLAGVIGAFTVPARPKFDPQFFKLRHDALLSKFDKSYEADNRIITNMTMNALVQKMEELTHSVMTPLQRLEHIWHLPVAFFVIPVFALVNAGVHLSAGDIAAAVQNPVLWGVTAGLVLGKFAGILGACALAVKLGLAQLPQSVGFAQIAGAALLAGIGFTMSIFISGLAFEDNEELLRISKIGILAASLISGVSGYGILRRAGRKTS